LSREVAFWHHASVLGGCADLRYWRLTDRGAGEVNWSFLTRSGHLVSLEFCYTWPS